MKLKKSLFAFQFVVFILSGCGSEVNTKSGARSKETQTQSKIIPTASSTLLIPDSWRYPVPQETIGTHGMVVTDAALASRVGREILAKGGNAIDAAVATAFAMAVVYPMAGNIGGGGFLVARMDGQPYALDFRETAPLQATRDMFLYTAGNPMRNSETSDRAAGVPGSVAGLFAAYQKLGSKKIAWSDLLAPAIRLAQEGFPMDETFVKLIQKHREKLERNPASAALFLKGGAIPTVGDHFRNTDLAKVLTRIAEKGVSGFYEGPTADLVVKEMISHEGLITAEDLKTYQVKWRTPLEFDYRGYHIVSMPPPSSGGITLAMICHLLETYPMKQFQWHSVQHLHVILEAMRRAFIARNASLGDPDFVKNPVELLLSQEWAETQRASIVSDRATASLDLTKPVPHGKDGPHTTHFSIVDAQGNAVALTTTLNLWFGSGITVPGAGFLLNDEMDDFAIEPGQPNQFGLVQGESNAIAPKKRMLSSMTPAVILDPQGHLFAVAGAAGGPTIITAVFQILSNLVDFQLSPGLAGSTPRIHMQDFPDQVLYEKEGLPQEIKQSLEQMGYHFEERERIADALAIVKQNLYWIGVPEIRTKSSEATGF